MIETLNFRGIQVPIHCFTEAEAAQVRQAPNGGNMMPGWVEFWEQCFAPGDEVIDFGAHVGIFSVIFLLLGARVHAVEGCMESALMLMETLNPWRGGGDGRQVIIHPYAVSDYLSIECGQFNDCRDHKDQVVRFVKWDDEEITQLMQPTFVKMDIEGAETIALSHMKRLLEEDRPIWQIEYHKGLTVDYGQGFKTPEQGGFDFSTFSRLGYRIFNEELKPVPEVTEAGNYFFVPEEAEVEP